MQVRVNTCSFAKKELPIFKILVQYLVRILSVYRQVRVS